MGATGTHCGHRMAVRFLLIWRNLHWSGGITPTRRMKQFKVRMGRPEIMFDVPITTTLRPPLASVHNFHFLLISARHMKTAVRNTDIQALPLLPAWKPGEGSHQHRMFQTHRIVGQGRKQRTLSSPLKKANRKDWKRSASSGVQSPSEAATSRCCVSMFCLRSLILQSSAWSIFSSASIRPPHSENCRHHFE